MKALDCLNEIQSRYVNSGEIDWEALLEHGYRRFLDRDSVVLDVGGHEGRHTEIFVNTIGCAAVRVFEPLPALHRKLQSRFAGVAAVDVLPYALGAECGSREFVHNTSVPSESGLKERIYNDPEGARTERIRVEVRTLDSLDLNADRVDFIKIDTEGGECDIIKGARRSIDEFRPVLSVEYGHAGYSAYGYSWRSLYDLTEEMDYCLFDLLGNRIESIDEWRACVDKYYWDFYAVAREQAEAFASRLARLVDEIPACVVR
jgi:FkbM family methyltransferase